jgi:hypothetical protein
MKTNWIHGLGLFGLMLVSTGTTEANDIVNFLRAVSGPPAPRQAPVIQQVGYRDHGTSGVHGAGYGDRNVTSRDIYKHNMQVADRDMHYLGYSQQNSRFNQGGFDPRRVDLRHSNYARGNSGSVYSSRSGARISFQVTANNGPSYGQRLYIPTQDQVQVLPPVQQLPPVQSYPVAPPYPISPVVPAFPHQVGEIVDCHVPLATCVRVEDECDIAPNAVPVVVAVRDPKMCAHDVVERVVFVQVFVPPCPPRSIEISRCRTRVTMDFGRYEVDIKSRNGMIVVDYDN